MTVSSWDDLATVALLGTARRQLGDLRLPEALRDVLPDASPDPAVGLLDAAAMATVYLRAGLRAQPSRPLPAPAPPDPRPVVRAAACARLSDLLAADDRDLLRLWLSAANERGLRPPHPSLPRLLDLAARDASLAAPALAAAGPRGRWLAAYRSHWAQAAGRASSDAAERPGREDERSWELGTPDERRSWLGSLRARDPASARRLLESGWTAEAPAERARLLAVLAACLGPDDEAFLERCLDDRRPDVRAVAARLLTALPGSALAARARDRGRRAVARERHLLQNRLVVTEPAGHDTAMGRDQIPPPPKGTTTGRGPGAWLVAHIVAAAPLDTWVPALGDSAAAVTGLAVDDGWELPLWFGWARATLRERDAGWAAALLGRVPSPGQAPSPGRGQASSDLLVVPGLVTELFAVLGDRERARYLAQLLAARSAPDARGAGPPVPAAVLLRQVPGPWSRPLTGAVLAWLHRRSRLDDSDGRAVLDLAARRLPVELAGALRELAERWPELSPGRRFAAAAAELMDVRRELLEELQ